MTTDNELTHYGKKGMKWGVTNNSGRAAGTAPAVSDITTSVKKTATSVVQKSNLRRDAKRDLKAVAEATPRYRPPTSQKYQKAQAKIADRSATDKGYKAAIARRQEINNFKSSTGYKLAKKVLITYAALKIADVALSKGEFGNGRPSTAQQRQSARQQQTSRGQSYTQSRPAMMNTKLSDGVYNVTSL